MSSTVQGQMTLPAPFYQDQFVTIYHGSSVDMWPGCFSPECVITDPPYGVGFKYGVYQDTPENFDTIRAFISHFSQRSAQMALMMGQRQLWTMPRPKWVLCWAKPGSTRRSDLGGFNEWEPVLLYGEWKGVWNDLFILPDCANHTSDIAAEHPCPKPLKLLTKLVSLSAGVVCDPFMGSGTTLLAAKNLNRKAIGWDVDERYCEIAAKRMEQEVLDFGASVICPAKVEERSAHLFPLNP